MNTQILMPLALTAGLLAANPVQARPVTAQPEALTGYIPHRSLLPAGQASADSPGARYYGESFRPLVIQLPQEQAQDTAPLAGASAGSATRTAMLYTLLAEQDDPEMQAPRRSAEEHHPGSRHGHRPIRLGEDDGQLGDDDLGGPAPVPLPPGLPLLASALGLLAVAAGCLRRRPAG